MERRTPPNLRLTGLPRRRGDDSVTASRFTFLRPQKSPVRQSDQGFFVSWKDASRIASSQFMGAQRMLASPSLAGTSPQRDRSARGNGDAAGTPLMKPAGLDVPECTYLVRRLPSGSARARDYRGRLAACQTQIPKYLSCSYKGLRRDGGGAPTAVLDRDGDPGSRAWAIGLLCAQKSVLS